MKYSLFINGVFESVLNEIVEAQAKNPDLVCYLQPYTDAIIKKLSNEVPSEANPVTLYISLTDSLESISYTADIIGWEYKPDISKTRLSKLNKHIRTYQPGEEKIYKIDEDKPAVNLIHVKNMRRLQKPASVASLIKISDNQPLSVNRTRSGGYSYVFPLEEFIKENTGISAEKIDKKLKKGIERSLKLKAAERKKRLEKANKFPEEVRIFSKNYKRNPDVIAEVLLRANGVCEHCKQPAPFTRASDGTPYLEVHHKQQLSEGKEDTVENALGVCPNCHKYFHYGIK